MTARNPNPKPRGGRRPGAGAPKGNTNALKFGTHSGRYADAIRLIAAIPGLLAYMQKLNRMDATPEQLERGTRLRRDLLEAAREVIVATAPAARPEPGRRGTAGRMPEPGERNLAMELEALIYLNLHGRALEVPGGFEVLERLAKPIDRRRPLRRALILTTWCAHHDAQLERALAEHILADLEPTLEKIAKMSIKQSNAAANPNPESTEAP